MPETAQKVAHTPGPWEAYCSPSAGWRVRTQNERDGYNALEPICSMSWWQFDIPGVIDNAISEANARLIAAAPELLSQLKGILEELKSGEIICCVAGQTSLRRPLHQATDYLIGEIGALIAKAEGN